MKLSGIFIFLICLQVSAKTTAQQISLTVKNATLDKVFSEIEKKTNYVFFYGATILRNTKPVSLEFRSATVEDIMNSALKGQSLEYSISNKTIFVKREGKVVAATAAPVPTDDGPGGVEVKGVVLNEAGLPLAGASVTALGTGKSIITNTRGEFKLNHVPLNSTLQVSYIGYSPKKVPFKLGELVQVQLAIADNQLDQSVVMAYGNTTQRLNTGDITKVTAKDLAEQPVSNPLEALEGRVPGLIINQTTGVPGGAVTVQLRGLNSLANGTDPFYVVDGVPYPSKIFGGAINNSLNGGSPLSWINISDIESIEVLKDADATAIYGSRAANGAILITTKKGKSGNMQVSVNAYAGWGKLARKEHLLNTRQYLDMRNEAFKNDATSPDPTRDYDLTFWDTTRYTDWQKVFLDNPAHYDDGQFSISGGNTSTQYLIGGSYHRETTVFPKLRSSDGSDQKGAVHFNINSVSSDKRFRVSLLGSYISDLSRVQPIDFYQPALLTPPDAPKLYNSDGSLNWMPLVPGQAGTWSNPMANLYATYKNSTSNLIANSILSYTVLSGLDVKVSVGYTNTESKEIQAIPTTFFDPGANITSGQSSFNISWNKSWIFEPQLAYKADIGGGILNALFGSTIQSNTTAYQFVSALGFTSDAFLNDMQAATSLSATSSNSEYKYAALFGRVNYNWNDKYIINLTARRDGSSRFGPGKQFANFGAIGAGWIFTKERFIEENFHFLSFGKIRASYGTSGNDQIADYSYLDLYSLTNFPYQNTQTLHPTSLFNQNLQWELNKKAEIGVELGFLKDRIIVQADFYKNRCGDQLLSTPVTLVTGFSAIPANLPAVVQNTGQEFIFNTVNVKTKSFSWSSSFNISTTHNKLISYPGLATSGYANTFQIGRPINALKVFHSLGVNDTTGVYQFASQKGPTYNPDALTDKTVWVNKTPKYFGGFRNTFQYKEFSLDFLLQFVKQIGGNIWSAYSNMPGVNINFPTAVLNRWQQNGDKKPIEQYSQNYGSMAYNQLGYAQGSDFIYSDASFVRLKNVSFSWSMPAKICHRLRLQNVRFYLQGQNLLTVTHYNGIDPESQNLSIPPLKVYTAGFQVVL